jgi:putative heme-binding domain-containing protein
MPFPFIFLQRRLAFRVRPGSLSSPYLAMTSVPSPVLRPFLGWRLVTSAVALLSLAGLSGCNSAPAAAVPPAAPAPVAAPATAPAAPFSFANGEPREVQVEQLTPLVNRALRTPRNFEHGKNIFQTHSCAFCHRFGEGAGGIGPDISGVGGRMGTDGILTEIIDPSLKISDLFGKKTVTTKDGQTFTGRMIGDNADVVTLVQNYVVDPTTMTFTWEGGNQIKIKAGDVDTIEDATESPMPTGLIDDLKVDDVADLLAYLISGADPSNRLFQSATAAAKP